MDFKNAVNSNEPLEINDQVFYKQDDKMISGKLIEIYNNYGIVQSSADGLYHVIYMGALSLLPQ